MISYDELCAVLERYQARKRGEEVPATSLPGLDYSNEHTVVGEAVEVIEDRSQVLDTGDILSDEPGSN